MTHNLAIPEQHVQATFTAAEQQVLHIFSADELLARPTRPREYLLEPWLPTQGLALLYAYRGVGKTLLAMSIAAAVATGSRFMRWQAPRPQRVLYLDGELPGIVMRERLELLKQLFPERSFDQLDVVTPDEQPAGQMLDLGTEEGQALLERQIPTDTRLIIVDNLSTLAPGLEENDSMSWGVIQRWLLCQRAAGRSVLLVHHAGKGGTQRGTSRREDVLDTVIALRHSSDYTASHGAVFEVHIEKARGMRGATVAPFRAELATGEWGELDWATKPVGEGVLYEIVELLAAGMTQTEIAERLKVNKSTISRKIKEARQQGLLV